MVGYARFDDRIENAANGGADREFFERDRGQSSGRVRRAIEPAQGERRDVGAYGAAIRVSALAARGRNEDGVGISRMDNNFADGAAGESGRARDTSTDRRVNGAG